MMHFFRVFISVFVLACASSTWAQGEDTDAGDEQSAQAIYRQVARFLQEADSFSFDATLDMSIAHGDQKQKMPTRTARMTVKRPNMLYFHVESRKAGEAGNTAVSDGEQLMVHSGTFGRYTISPAPPTMEKLFVPPSEVSLVLDQMVLLQYLFHPGITEEVNVLTEQSRVVGVEEFNGEKVRHIRLVTEVGEEGDGPTRMPLDLWVQAEGKPLVRKFSPDLIAMYKQAEEAEGEQMMEITQTIRLDGWRINEPIPAERFAIHPPEGAKKVDSILDAGTASDTEAGTVSDTGNGE